MRITCYQSAYTPAVPDEDFGIACDSSQLVHTWREYTGGRGYDHGARHYDPVTGRWNTMDKMCEKYYDVSPYASCGDDPVNAFDPDGMDWYWDRDKTWQFIRRGQAM